MLEHTKKPPTDTVILSFAVPSSCEAEARKYLQALGCTLQEKEKDNYSIDEIFAYSEQEKPAVCLKGARYRESMTQAQLALATGIPARHISEMENCKRPIGKQNAKKLAEALNINPNRLIAI